MTTATTGLGRVAAQVLVRFVTTAATVAIFASLLSPVAIAQQPTQRPRQQAPRRGATIEIRGQVPTPQVVTVRPRETPGFSRRVLVPGILDHDFWPSILPPLDIVSPAGTRSDTTSRSTADSTARARSTNRVPPGTPPAPLRR
jgi:hypothetical protein